MRLDFSLILKVKHEYFCPGPGVINFFFILNSTEHEIYHAHKC